MAGRDLSAVYTKKKLFGLNRLLDSWREALKAYGRIMGMEENAWWFNERATLSTLAGAAWRLTDDWLAIEEYCTQKRGVVPRKNVDPGELVHGRCDLYLSNKGTDYAFEAKQAWQPIGSKARKKAVGKAMKGAWDAVGKLDCNEACFRVAAVFVVPYLPLSEVAKPGTAKKKVVDQKLVRERVKDWLATLELKDYDAFAHYFPMNCRGYVGYGGSVFPGVVLLLRVRRKATKIGQSGK